jgi:hypothetical protein
LLPRLSLRLREELGAALALDLVLPQALLGRRGLAYAPLLCQLRIVLALRDLEGHLDGCELLAHVGRALAQHVDERGKVGGVLQSAWSRRS